MVDLKLNKPLNPDIRIVGNERTPVVVIDEPILTTEELIRYASARANFGTDSQFAYPGIRSDLPAEYAQALVPELVDLISHIYKPPRSYEVQLIHQLFSLVTRKPGELRPLQRVPHFDNHSPYYFATVHYLNPGDHAGTGSRKLAHNKSPSADICDGFQESSTVRHGLFSDWKPHKAGAQDPWLCVSSFG